MKSLSACSPSAVCTGVPYEQLNNEGGSSTSSAALAAAAAAAPNPEGYTSYTQQEQQQQRSNLPDTAAADACAAERAGGGHVLAAAAAACDASIGGPVTSASFSVPASSSKPSPGELPAPRFTKHAVEFLIWNHSSLLYVLV
jgi:hypothetical protein